MKTKPFAVRLPLALAVAIERKAELENVTVADIIRSILAASQSGDQAQTKALLQSIENQVKGLRLGQAQILQKLAEFEAADGGDQS